MEQEYQTGGHVESQTPEELSEYQRAMIAAEAHELWLKRQASGEPGDPATDWEEAERHYFSNN